MSLRPDAKAVKLARKPSLTTATGTLARKPSATTVTATASVVTKTTVTTKTATSVTTTMVATKLSAPTVAPVRPKRPRVANDSVVAHAPAFTKNKRAKTDPLPPKSVSGCTTVVRLRRKKTGEIVQDCDVYIGRALTMGGWNLPTSKWHNPFRVERPPPGEKWSATQKREAVVRAVGKFETYIMDAKQTALRDAIPAELAGRTLGCWCKTKPSDPCHGDVLARLANKS